MDKNFYQLLFSSPLNVAFFLVVFTALILSLWKTVLRIKIVRKLTQRKLFDSGTCVASWQNLDYIFVCRTASRHFIGYLKIAVGVGLLKGKFKARKTSIFDGFLKIFKKELKIESGNLSFDNKVYVTSDDALWTQEFFSCLKTRQAVLQLLELGFTEIVCNGGVFELIQKPLNPTYKFLKSVSPEVIFQLIQEFNPVSLSEKTLKSSKITITRIRIKI